MQLLILFKIAFNRKEVEGCNQILQGNSWKQVIKAVVVGQWRLFREKLTETGKHKSFLKTETVEHKLVMKI